MGGKNLHDNNKKLLSLLQAIDQGYKPTVKELQELTQIITLSFNETNIDIIPLSIKSLFNLQTLNLTYTQVSDLSPLSNLQNLQTLDLSNTQVSDLSPLSNLQNLQTLYLISDTQVSNLSPLSNLQNLQTLDLRDTQVSDLSPLSNLQNLQTLDLRDTQVSDLSPLSNLQNLQTLYLISNTQVSDLSPLSNLQNLQTLDLSNTKASDLSSLSNLQNLQTLYLSSNTQVSDLSSLSSFQNLQMLYLSKTQVSDLSPLTNLQNLQKLYLSRTQVSDLNPLVNLQNLRMLDLSNTQVSDLSPLTNLQNLQKLYLSRTQVSDLSPLINLQNLQVLDLSNTQVSDLSPLSNLQNLQTLDLSNIQIHTLPCWFGKLKQLISLNLAELHLNSIPEKLLSLNLPFVSNDFFLYERRGINLYRTTLATQPISLFEQPWELIQTYYNSERIPINEAKVIFLGDGGAGKTHTIKRIQNGGKKNNYETETTPGIDITDYMVNRDGHQFNIHFWDFGGQEIMHAMHRCFLTDRTCYVVVVSSRGDQLNSRARYWLKNIDSFAKNAPVILAVNRWDNILGTGIDMRRLTQDYPNLVMQPVYYSAKDSDDSEFGLLIDTIIREASKLDSTAMSFPVQWANIRQRLLKMGEKLHYVDKEEYHEICNQQGLASLKIRTWLLEWFNDLGICFSYHQDKTEKNELDAYKVLNPRWLTNAIYIIINAGKQYADKGRINRNLIQLLLSHSEYGVLPDVTYSATEQGYVLDVMRKFNLSYAVSDSLEFIPALCEDQTPEILHPTTFEKRVSYQMKYTYLPDSVVHQLMIRSYKDLNPDKIWRKGLRIDLERFHLIAVVDMGSDDSTLRIDVYSNGTLELWKLLHSIRKDILAINKELGLQAEDYIIVREEFEDIPIKVNLLLNAKAQGRKSYPIYIDSTGQFYDCSVDMLLGMTFGEEIMAVAEKQVLKEKSSQSEIAPKITIEIINHVCEETQSTQRDALAIIQYLIRQNDATTTKLLDYLLEALDDSDIREARDLAEEAKQNPNGQKNLLQRLEATLKTSDSIISSGKNIYSTGKWVVDVIHAVYPKILEHLPDLQNFLSPV